MKKILLTGILISIFCCSLPVMAAKTSEVITPQTQLQKRQYQTRQYDNIDKATLMKAMLNVLQDEGFIVNNASCFPEIAGSAAVYFNMNEYYSNLDEVLERFIQLSQIEIEQLLSKQLERLKLYSWDRAASQLTEIYRNILQN